MDRGRAMSTIKYKHTDGTIKIYQGTKEKLESLGVVDSILEENATVPKIDEELHQTTGVIQARTKTQSETNHETILAKMKARTATIEEIQEFLVG